MQNREKKTDLEKFTDKKIRNEDMTDVFVSLGDKYPAYEKRAERMSQCGSFLKFNKYEKGTKLIEAYFCKNRLCPMCNWRRSLKIFSQVIKIVNYIKEIKNYRFIFLTLTLKNCQKEDLRETINELLKGFKTMMKYKRLGSIEGYFRAVEVTYNKETDEFHPHIHVLCCVTNNYFRKGNYITQPEYRELFKKALKINYLPVVNVKTVKEKTSSGVAEICKYPVKDSDFIVKGDSDLTEEIILSADRGLRSLRLIDYGGIMKTAKSEIKQTDEDNLINTDLNDDDLGNLIGQIMFNWSIGFRNYTVTEC